MTATRDKAADTPTLCHLFNFLGILAIAAGLFVGFSSLSQSVTAALGVLSGGIVSGLISFAIADVLRYLHGIQYALRGLRQDQTAAHPVLLSATDQEIA